MKEIDLKSQSMPNTSAFLKWRDRPAGILAGINHNGQPSKETFLYSVWEAAVLNNSGFFYYKASSHFSKQRETFFQDIIESLSFFSSFALFSSTTGSLRSIILKQVQYRSSSSLGCS